MNVGKHAVKWLVGTRNFDQLSHISLPLLTVSWVLAVRGANRQNQATQ